MLSGRRDQLSARLDQINLRLNAALPRKLEADRLRLANLDKLRLTLNPKRPPRPGFVLVTRTDGSIIPRGADLVAGEGVNLMFEDATREAVIDGAPSAAPTPAASPRSTPKKPPAPPAGQGDLF